MYLGINYIPAVNNYNITTLDNYIWMNYENNSQIN